MARFVDIEPYDKLGYRHLIRLTGGSVETAVYTPVDEIPTVDIIEAAKNDEEIATAIEKQVPMKVKIIDNHWHLCPRCFKQYGFSYDILVGMTGLKTGKCYCLNCGQLIDMG